MKKFILLMLFICIFVNTFPKTFNEFCKDRLNMQENITAHVIISKAYDVFDNVWGVNLSIFGIYTDVSEKSPNLINYSNVSKWNNQCCFSGHIGYQIPIYNWLRITPIFGIYIYKKGYVKDYDDMGYGTFVPLKQYKKFDPGISVQTNTFLPKGNIDISFMFNYTYHIKSIGFGIFISNK